MAHAYNSALRIGDLKRALMDAEREIVHLELELWKCRARLGKDDPVISAATAAAYEAIERENEALPDA